ncbi:MAG: hypothetical protein LBK44_06760 [Spirochaetales bacterium]|nr:hypothetical protein [Spirochaetales bacterium]
MRFLRAFHYCPSRGLVIRTRVNCQRQLTRVARQGYTHGIAERQFRGLEPPPPLRGGGNLQA